jgi:hypothetical protein
MLWVYSLLLSSGHAHSTQPGLYSAYFHNATLVIKPFHSRAISTPLGRIALLAFPFIYPALLSQVPIYTPGWSGAIKIKYIANKYIIIQWPGPNSNPLLSEQVCGSCCLVVSMFDSWPKGSGFEPHNGSDDFVPLGKALNTHCLGVC